PTRLGVALLLLGAGLSVMLFLAGANATLQLNSSAAMRGRVMALYGLVLLGTTPLGAPLLGFVSGQWGARVGLAVCGAASLAASVAAMAVPGLRRRQLAGEERLGPAPEGAETESVCAA
ncbi:MAG: MFS transporter, partial [Acidimicrobiales bacterium]